jgi:hypothetical protein
MLLCVIFVSASTSPVLVEICDACVVERWLLSVSCSCFFISPASSSSQLTTRALSWIVHLLPKRIVRNSFLVWDFHEHFFFCVIFVSPTTSLVLVEICDSFVERGYLSVSCSNCFSLLLLFSRLTRALLWIVRNSLSLSLSFFFFGYLLFGAFMNTMYVFVSSHLQPWALCRNLRRLRREIISVGFSVRLLSFSFFS